MNLYQILDHYLFRSIDISGASRPTSDLFIWPYDSSIKLTIHCDHLQAVEHYLACTLSHLLIVYSHSGNLLGQHLINSTDEVTTIIASYQADLIDSHPYCYGTFSLFHFTDDTEAYNFALPTLAEKSICSYYSEISNNVCLMHGNLNERSLIRKSNLTYSTMSNIMKLPFKRSYIVPIPFQPMYFSSPGLTYNSVILKNSLDSLLEVSIQFLTYHSSSRSVIKTHSLDLTPLSTHVIYLTEHFPDFTFDFVTMIIKTNVFMLRPILAFHSKDKDLMSLHHS